MVVKVLAGADARAGADNVTTLVTAATDCVTNFVTVAAPEGVTVFVVDLKIVVTVAPLLAVVVTVSIDAEAGIVEVMTLVTVPTEWVTSFVTVAAEGVSVSVAVLTIVDTGPLPLIVAVTVFAEAGAGADGVATLVIVSVLAAPVP